MATENYLLFPAKDAKERTENINSDYKTLAGEATQPLPLNHCDYSTRSS